MLTLMCLLKHWMKRIPGLLKFTNGFLNGCLLSLCQRYLYFLTILLKLKQSFGYCQRSPDRSFELACSWRLCRCCGSQCLALESMKWSMGTLNNKSTTKTRGLLSGRTQYAAWFLTVLILRLLPTMILLGLATVNVLPLDVKKEA